MLTSLTVTPRNNTNNPTGSVFAPVSPAPVPTVTFTLSNQQYSLPTSVTSTGTGSFIGTTGANTYFAPLSSVGTPSNSDFTSAGGAATGTGISTVFNHGVRLYNSSFPLASGGVGNLDRVHMADLTITFSVPVTDPILHFSGLGGFMSYGSANKGFSTEFDMLPGGSPGVTSITRLSGNSAFTVSGNSINNTSTNHSASCATGQGACGSVQFNGSGLTQISLRVYLRSTTNRPWNFFYNTNTAGDAYHISVSAETADMTPVFSGLPTEIVPGTTYSGTLTCTNLGPNTARGAVCVPTVLEGSLSNIVCTPAVPADIVSTAPNNTTVCTFDYVLPVGGTEVQELFAGQSGATNDRNGGLLPTAGNNLTQAIVPVRGPRVTLNKVLNGTPGRDQATDQFSLTITGTGGPATTTTGGSGTTVTNGTTTITAATAGQTYTFSEALAGTASSANYTTAVDFH